MRWLFLGLHLLQPARRRARQTTPSLITAALLTFCFVPQSVGAAQVADRIVAIVNKDVITLSEMKAEITETEARLRQQYQGAEFDRRLRQLEYRVLTLLIERTLQMQLAREKGHVVTDEEVRRAVLEIARRGEPVDPTDPRLVKSVKEHLTLLRVVEREVQSGIMVSEDELQRYYEDHLSRFMLPEEYRLSQILTRPRGGEAAEETQARAADVHAALRKGADFADLARRRSDGAEATQGGHLGFIKQGELESPIERAIARLQPGEFSEPIKTDDGFHIVRLDERKPPVYRQYAQVKAEIQNLVHQQKSEAQYHKWLNELKDKAYIEVKF